NGKTWTTVVGVVSNVRQYGLDKESADSIYFPLYQVGLTGAHLLVRTRSDPKQPVTQIRTLDELRSAQLGTPRVTATLLGLFAVVALFITIVGVSGTLALSVARRSKEFGIRIALGATKERILSNVLVRGMAPVLAGLAGGVSAAIFATRVLANLLFAV